ncbi:MAG: protein-L-isoaspartate(D-aspartate) O-methyltransferase [Candidatus Poseidoniales archaeon]|nr:protein-L-isoaspartate(D-aspartate) O-methyltransferase [Candidatus Poseidoniales archaeon]
MVDEQLLARDIEDQRVLKAMQSVPRHAFVPEGIRASAHMDNPLPIGHDQTISQPYIVALMTQLLAQKVPVGGRILEIGSGSGYQTAILVSMGFEVHCIEVIPELVQPSREALSSIGLEPASMIIGDGHLGMSAKAPFDGILAAACARKLPKAWRNQLKEGGVIVAPVKRSSGQYLFRWTKKGRALKRENIIPVRFVPLLKS